MKNKRHFQFRKLCLVLALILTQCIWAQERKVTGTVTDSKQEPLIGVNVTVKGAPGIGTITDLDGKFSLSIPSGRTVLVFSYIGYTAQEANVGSKGHIDVALLRSPSAGSDIGVSGQGNEE